MKKIILLSLLTLSLTAQTQRKIKTGNLFSAQKLQSAPANTLYTFTTFTEAYQPITGNSLSNSKKWDDPFYSIPIGFEFKLYSDHGTTINFIEGSGVSFNNASASVITLMSPMFEDLCDRAFDPSVDNEGDPGGISDISYTVTGMAGSRICKIQISNAGFFGEIDAGDSSVSFVNFQAWLYEGTNDIEFRYGNVDIQNPGDNLNNPAGFICGLGEKVDLNTANSQSSNVLNGPHANPTMVALSNTLNEVVTGAIQSGRVYKFSRVNPNLAGVGSLDASQQINLYPNPASNTLYFKGDGDLLKKATISFYSLDGRLVSSKELATEINLTDMKKGIYFVKIFSQTSEQLYAGKLIIAD